METLAELNNNNVFEPTTSNQQVPENTAQNGQTAENSSQKDQGGFQIKSLFAEIDFVGKTPLDLAKEVYLRASELKIEGNKLYQVGKFDEASVYYHKASKFLDLR